MKNPQSVKDEINFIIKREGMYKNLTIGSMPNRFASDGDYKIRITKKADEIAEENYGLKDF